MNEVEDYYDTSSGDDEYEMYDTPSDNDNGGTPLSGITSEIGAGSYVTDFDDDVPPRAGAGAQERFHSETNGSYLPVAGAQQAPYQHEPRYTVSRGVHPSDLSGNARGRGYWRSFLWGLLMCYQLVRNLVVGVFDILRMLVGGVRKAATFRVIPPDSMFSRSVNPTTATGGALVISIVVQSWILMGLVYLTIAVGVGGALAEVVEISYLKVSTPALFSVPLGLYIFAWGGLQAKTTAARNIMTVYGVAETSKMVGDLVNLVRYIHLVHTRDHWTVLFTNSVPEWLASKVDSEELATLKREFKHGDCAEPHAIIVLLLISMLVTMILSFMNVSTVVWRNISNDIDLDKMPTSDVEQGHESEEEPPRRRFAKSPNRRGVRAREAYESPHDRPPAAGSNAWMVDRLIND